MTYTVQKRWNATFFPWVPDNEWQDCCKCVSMEAAQQYIQSQAILPSFTAFEFRVEPNGDE